MENIICEKPDLGQRASPSMKTVEVLALPDSWKF
jgi:hypothetical protein